MNEELIKQIQKSIDNCRTRIQLEQMTISALEDKLNVLNGHVSDKEKYLRGEIEERGY